MAVAASVAQTVETRIRGGYQQLGTNAPDRETMELAQTLKEVV